MDKFINWASADYYKKIERKRRKSFGQIKVRVVPKRFQRFEYEGEYRYGDMHGKGKATFKDGRIYTGDFKNNRITGKGKMVYLRGKILEYEGGFKKGKFEGYGEVKYRNG